MTAVVIATELQRRDWAELRAYLMEQSAPARPRINSRLVAFALAAGPLALSFAFLHFAGSKHGASAALLGAALGILSLFLLQKLYAAKFRNLEPRAFLGPLRYELDEHGIRMIRTGISASVDWNRIEQIDETPNAIYLRLDGLSAYVIPKRSVDGALLPDLVAQLRAWHAERTRTPGSEPAPAFAAVQSVAITRDAAAGAPEKRVGFLRDLLGNLRAGLKLLLFQRVRSNEFTASFDQLVALLAIVIALLTGLDWLLADSDTVFDPYGYYVWAYYAVAGLWGAALIARLQGPQTNTRPLLVAWLAAVPGFIVVLGLVLLLPFGQTWLPVVLGGAALVLLVMSDRAARSAFGFAKFGTVLLVALTVIGVPYVFQTRLSLDPHLWVAPESEDDASADDPDAGEAESLLFDQADRISDAVGSTAPQRPGVVDTYFVGFAGWGTQAVFRNEALFGERIFAKRFGTARRSVELINDRTDRDTYPLATVSGLRYALQLLGERMDKDEDMLVLLLTSHGSREAGIAVHNGGLPLVDLEPDELRSALDDSGIKWRIVIVSACYAGVFLEPLKSDTTLVITAADADHNSFGCADDRDLTYFGEAFLRDSLPGAPTLEAAFAKARKLIAEREAEEQLTPSNPQMSVGSAIRQKLAAPASPADEAPGTAVPNSTITASLAPRAVTTPTLSAMTLPPAAASSARMAQ
jgi:hypothetical protein